MKRLSTVFLLFTSLLLSQNKFYNYYTAGLEYMEKQDWQRAIVEFRSAISLEFEDVQRKRTYGTRFIEYYPHREIGIAHYMVGEPDAAKKELELSIAYRSTGRAEEYYKRITGGLPPQKPIVKKEEAKQKPPIVAEKKSQPVTQPSISSEITQQPKGNIIVVTRKYDPNALPQVGSRLAVAVLPFETGKDAAKYKDAVTNEMINELVNLRRFRVIERSAMDKIVSEQKIQASGFVDDKTAVKLGKIAGADALVIGNISMNGTAVKISARLVDVETGETLIAQDAASENTTAESLDATVTNVATLLYNELPIIEGDIIKVESEELFIDIGSIQGLRKGTKCVVFREGESIKHPISGEILGKKVTRLGEIIVIQVQDKFATVKPIETEQDIQVGDKVLIK
ncbi:MAG: CsgG/HfaB family protein [Bacteroidota bacterium]